MDAILERAAEVVVQKLSESDAGIFLLIIICITILLFPVWKVLFKAIKKKYDSYMQIVTQDRQDRIEMKQSLEKIVDHLPELDTQVSILSTELQEFKSLKRDFIDAYKEVKETVEDIRCDLRTISEKSDEADKRIVDSIGELSTATTKIESDIGIIFEGDNNEFRLYLTQLHADHIKNNKPMTSEIRQKLRVRFDNYSSRGGNGWAKDLYLELMSLPVESFSFRDDYI